MKILHNIKKIFLAVAIILGIVFLGFLSYLTYTSLHSAQNDKDVKELQLEKEQSENKKLLQERNKYKKERDELLKKQEGAQSIQPPISMNPEPLPTTVPTEEPLYYEETIVLTPTPIL